MDKDMDYAVAKALGWDVVPSNRAYAGTFTSGVKYIFSHEGKLWLDAQATAHDAAGYNEWSPSTSADDAIAALEAWCGKYGVSWGLLGGAGYHCFIQFAGHRVEMIGEAKEAVICSTILLAASEVT